jgi:hypothetical protein
MLRVKTRNEGGRCGGVYVVWVAWVMLLLYVVRDRGGWGEEDRSWIKGVGTGRAPRERRAAHPSIKQVHWAIDRWNRTTGRRGPGGGAGFMSAVYLPSFTRRGRAELHLKLTHFAHALSVRTTLGDGRTQPIVSTRWAASCADLLPSVCSRRIGCRRPIDEW